MSKRTTLVHGAMMITIIDVGGQNFATLLHISLGMCSPQHRLGLMNKQKANQTCLLKKSARSTDSLIDARTHVVAHDADTRVHINWELGSCRRSC
jgi:hypothetical protein